MLQLKSMNDFPNNRFFQGIHLPFGIQVCCNPFGNGTPMPVRALQGSCPKEVDVPWKNTKNVCFSRTHPGNSARQCRSGKLAGRKKRIRHFQPFAGWRFPRKKDRSGSICSKTQLALVPGKTAQFAQSSPAEVILDFWLNSSLL